MKAETGRDAYAETLKEMRGALRFCGLNKKERQREMEVYRQDIAWSNAALGGWTRSMMNDFPDCTQDSIRELLEIMVPGVKEEVIVNFSASLAEQRMRAEMKKMSLVSNCLGADETDPRYMTEKERDVVGSGLFCELTGGSPKGRIRYIHSGWAVAILVQNQDDYVTLDSSGGGAFYKDSVIDGDGLEYPLIVMTNLQFQGHEEGHALNWTVVRTMEKLGVENVFPGNAKKVLIDGGIDEIKFEDVRRMRDGVQSAVGRLGKHGKGVKMVEKKIRLVELFEQYVFPQVFRQAKHELLADAQGKKWPYQFDYLSDLCTQEGLYDLCEMVYPSFVTKVSKTEKEAVWQKYTGLLKLYVQPAKTFSSFSKAEMCPEDLRISLLKKKDEVFPYLLAQFPLHEWPKRLEPYIWAREELVLACMELDWAILYRLGWRGGDVLPEQNRKRREVMRGCVRKILLKENDEYLPEGVLAQRVTDLAKRI